MSHISFKDISFPISMEESRKLHVNYLRQASYDICDGYLKKIADYVTTHGAVLDFRTDTQLFEVYQLEALVQLLRLDAQHSTALAEARTAYNKICQIADQFACELAYMTSMSEG